MWKSKFYSAFVLNHRVVLHAVDAMPAQWRGDAGSCPLDRAKTHASSPRNDLVKNYRVHPTHWLIHAQVFLGGSVLADIMRERSEFWMSKREFEEDGIDRCLAKCR